MKIIEIGYQCCGAIIDDVKIEIQLIEDDIDYFSEFIEQLFKIIENIKIKTGRFPLIGEQYRLHVWDSDDPVHLIVKDILYYSRYDEKNEFIFEVNVQLF